jgi:hypothetical protein
MQITSTASRSSSLIRQLSRAAVLVAVFCAATAQAGIKSEKFLSAILARTPAATIVSQGQQLKEAEKAAAQIPGAEALWGVGSSMEPLYASNTAIIVAPVNLSSSSAA